MSRQRHFTSRECAVAVAVPIIVLVGGVSLLAGPLGSPVYHVRRQGPAIGGLIVKVKAGYLPGGVRAQGSNGVILSAGADAAAPVRRWCAAYGVRGVRQLWPAAPGAMAASADHPGARTFIVGLNSSQDADSLASVLGALPWVEYAEVDRLLDLHQAPNDPLFPRQWDLENVGQKYWSVMKVPGDENDTLGQRSGIPGADIRYETARQATGPKATVIVGVIDTGVDTAHVELRGRIWTNPGEIPNNGIDDDHDGFVDDVCGWDFSGDTPGTPLDLIPDNDIADSMGHGTHVAGTIAAVADNGVGIAGICSEALILGVRIFPNSYFSVSAQGIYYAVARGARVLNMSWGGEFPSLAIRDALEYAHARGVVLVASMGNTGRDQLFYPAAYPQTIGVGATDANDTLASFSTYNDFVDLVAPGVDILSLRAAGTDLYADAGEPLVHIIDDRYLIASGTSMAAPHVTAAAAMLLSLAPGLTNERVREILRATAKDIVDPYGRGLYLPGWDRYTGAGRLDLAAAVAALPGTFVRIDTPQVGAWVGGDVAIAGSAFGSTFSHYDIEVSPGHIPGPLWTAVYSSSSPVSGGRLAVWQTAGQEGPFLIRLDAGADARYDVPVFVIQSPTARVDSPEAGDTVRVLRCILGTAAAPDFASYHIEAVGPLPSRAAHDVAWSSAPVWNDTLAVWRADSLGAGTYNLILTVAAGSGEVRRDSVSVVVRGAFMAGWPVQLPSPANFAVTAVNLDGTGSDEIVCPTGKGLYVLTADGHVYPGWPRDVETDVSTAPAIADLDGDGKYELIVASPTEMHVYAFIGEEYAGWPRPFQSGSGIYGNSLPTVGNLDGYGSLEVAAIDQFGRIRVWNENGTEYVPANHGQFGRINIDHSRFNSLSQISICDVDGDGRPELVVAGDGIYVYDGRTAAPYGTNPSACIRSHYSVHGMVVGDFNGDGVREIAYAAVDEPEAPYMINIIDLSGRSLPGWPRYIPQTQNKYLLYSLAAGDVDGDGIPEVFAAPYSLGDGYLYAFHGNGAPLGSDSTNGLLASLSGSVSAVTLVDIDGDGYPEIVVRVGELLFGPDRIVALKPDGSLVPGFPLVFGYGSAPTLSAPIIDDLNHDGQSEMITVQSTSTSVAVWELGLPASTAGRPWPKFRADLWNSGVLAQPRYDFVYLVRLIDMVVRRGEPLPPYEHPDINCDGLVTVTDIVTLINYMFRQGPAPCAR